MTKITSITHNARHGGAFDRGSADSYYRRAYRPHMFVKGTHTSEEITEENMTPADIASYRAGYDYNESLGDHKEWD
jgi:hypothetical protein